jgi:hypothetical protein
LADLWWNQQRCSRVVTAAATHTTHTTGTRTRASFIPAIDTSLIPHRRSRHAELRTGFQLELAGAGDPAVEEPTSDRGHGGCLARTARRINELVVPGTAAQLTMPAADTGRAVHCYLNDAAS